MGIGVWSSIAGRSGTFQHLDTIEEYTVIRSMFSPVLQGSHDSTPSRPHATFMYQRVDTHINTAITMYKMKFGI